jgi:hypothetical protein
LVDRANQNKFLEGTGSIVFDYQNKIAFACESPRTDINLFEEFCSLIGYVPFSFQSFDLQWKTNLSYQRDAHHRRSLRLGLS